MIDRGYARLSTWCERNLEEKPSGPEEELIFRLLIFFLIVLTLKKTLLIWFPPDLSGHGGINDVSSFENTELN